jgi:hypothetical protein
MRRKAVSWNSPQMRELERLKMKGMSRAGDPLHIPLSFDQAMSGLMKVKPTAEMPRAKKPVTKEKAVRKKRG